MISENLQRILEEFDRNDGTYKQKAMEEAVALKDEITPYLIDHLERLLSNPERYLEEGHWLNSYAFILLGHFREAKAHNVIVKIATLPEKVLDGLFGDMITEDFSWIFYATCGGSIERLRELVLDKTADEYCRGAAAQAIVYAVIGGVVTREAAIRFFSSLFTGSEASEGSNFWSSIATKIAHLYPEEAMGVIRKAYEEGLIYDGYIDYGSFEKALTEGRDKVLEWTRREMERRLNVDDIHSYMSWWACFNNKKQPSEFRNNRSYVASKNTRATRKKKKKIAKASRRKNRR
ncbi:MAG TPA: hypothetical protein DCP92_24520 [Nitrospiraceae bacterium]|jgi:hypothetical protein|nr:hypothetical protein [Nitrospiraceae bacterium]